MATRLSDIRDVQAAYDGRHALRADAERLSDAALLNELCDAEASNDPSQWVWAQVLRIEAVRRRAIRAA